MMRALAEPRSDRGGVHPGLAHGVTSKPLQRSRSDLFAKQPLIEYNRQIKPGNGSLSAPVSGAGADAETPSAVSGYKRGCKLWVSC
jgi:hypothetical protein